MQNENTSMGYGNPAAFAAAMQPAMPINERVAAVDLAHSGNQLPYQQAATPGSTPPNPPTPPSAPNTTPSPEFSPQAIEQAPPVAPYQELGTPNNSHFKLIVACVAVILLVAAITAFFVLRSGDTPPPITETPTNNNTVSEPEPASLTAPSGEVINVSGSDSTPRIRGTVTDPDALVSVSINGQTYEATVDEDGAWRVGISDALEEGTYPVAVTFMHAEDNSVSSQALGEVVVEAKADPDPEPTTDPDNEAPVTETPVTGPTLPTTGPA